MTTEAPEIEIADMTRDMELIRTILMRVQAKQDLELEIITINGIGEEVLGRHIEMVWDAGFLDGIARNLGINASRNFKTILVKDLSWEGHEFVGAIGHDEIWQKVKEDVGVSALVRLPLKAVKDASIAAATYWLKAKLGL